MPKKLLTTFLLFLYVLLFQVYPIVHLHCQAADGFELCLVTDTSQCQEKAQSFDYDHHHHHDHVQADFAHFYAEKDSSDKKHRCDFHTGAFFDATTEETQSVLFVEAAQHFPAEFVADIPTNKSPPSHS